MREAQGEQNSIAAVEKSPEDSCSSGGERDADVR